MNPFAALDHQPAALQPAQLLLMGVFLTAYLAAVTSLLEPRGRMRAAGIAALAGIGMGFVFTPWTLGALLAAGSVGAVGVFIGLSWVLSRALGVHDRAPVVEDGIAVPDEVEAAEAESGAAVPAPARSAPRFNAPTAPAPLI